MLVHKDNYIDGQFKKDLPRFQTAALYCEYRCISTSKLLNSTQGPPPSASHTGRGQEYLFTQVQYFYVDS